jgi:hypothetical protein
MAQVVLQKLLYIIWDLKGPVFIKLSKCRVNQVQNRCSQDDSYLLQKWT